MGGMRLALGADCCGQRQRRRRRAREERGSGVCVWGGGVGTAIRFGGRSWNSCVSKALGGADEHSQNRRDESPPPQPAVSGTSLLSTSHLPRPAVAALLWRWRLGRSCTQAVQGSVVTFVVCTCSGVAVLVPLPWLLPPSL